MRSDVFVTNRDGVAYLAFQDREGVRLVERIGSNVQPIRSAEIIRLPTRVRYQDRTQ